VTPLSILIWLPAASGILGAAVSLRPWEQRRTERAAPPPDWWAKARATGRPVQAREKEERLGGGVALLGALGTLGLAIAYIAGFDSTRAGLQDVTDVTWIGELGIHYKLGLSGLNLFLVALTALLFAAATLAANLRSWERPRLFYFHFMLAESAVLGAFLAQDLALFVAFFDLMLIPFYFLIGGWGREPGRVRATIKLVIYTLVGSLLMLAAAVATGVLTAQHSGGHITFALSALSAHPLGGGSQDWLFLFFAAAFLVKMPAFPLHGWMPDGYRAMPIEVLMVFSGVLAKVGAYGFLAIALPLFPHAAVHFQTLLLLIALASILYGSLMAFTQTDARLVAGYSSVAQLGFITLGIFSLRSQGAQGALLQMVNHGLVVAPLFFIIALLAQRSGGSEDLREMGGIAFRAPLLATLFLLVALATLAMPGSTNFVGEFLILLGVFKAKLAIAAIAFAGVVAASVYALRLLIGAMHNRVGPRVHSFEIAPRDGIVLVPLVGVIVALSLYPQLALHRSERAVNRALAGQTATPAGVYAGFARARAAAAAQRASNRVLRGGSVRGGGAEPHFETEVKTYARAAVAARSTPGLRALPKGLFEVEGKAYARAAVVRR
jgi:NADH-quinone oxidoreductase subunit M